MAKMENTSDIDIRRFYMRHLLEPTSYESYRTGQRKHCDVAIVIPATILFLGSSIVKIQQDYTIQGGCLWYLKYLCNVVFGILLVTNLITRLIVHYDKGRNHISYIVSKRLLNLCSTEVIENVFGIFLTLAIGLQFLGRVRVARRDESEKRICCDNSSTIPHDQVLLLYSIPLITQSAFRCMGLRTLALSWAVILFIVAVGGFLNSWTLLYSGIFINITFAIEWLKFTSYLDNECALAEVRRHHAKDLSDLEATIENDKKMCEEKMIELHSLMGNVAHDLKTPLHSIEADLEVLHDYIAETPGAMKIAGPIFSSLTATCMFMGMAINRSQIYMKSTSNIGLVPVLETFELASVLKMAVDCINHLQTGRVINLHPLGSDICSFLISDKHWLCENIICFLSNAIKYSDEGDVDVRVALINSTDIKPMPTTMDGESQPVSADPVDSAHLSIIAPPNKYSDVAAPEADEIMEKSVIFTFEDRGIGITEDSRKDLFQPFKKAQRMAGGTGLGLYSLAKRIDAMGGAYGVSDRTDGMQGSNFWFAFPYRPDEAASAYDPNSPVPISLDLVRSRSILVVDDSIPMLKVTTRQLEINGHSVRTAKNGSIGLKMLEAGFANQEYDIVMTDLQMPVMDGLEATRRYRAFERDAIHAESLRGSLSGSFKGSVNELSNGESKEAVKGNEWMKGSERMKGSESASLGSSQQPARRRMLIIGISGSCDDVSAQEALDAGMDYYFTKPFQYSGVQRIFDTLESRGEIDGMGARDIGWGFEPIVVDAA